MMDAISAAVVSKAEGTMLALYRSLETERKVHRKNISEDRRWHVFASRTRLSYATELNLK